MAKNYVVDKKEAEKKKKDSFFKRTGKFFKDTRSELKKVVWPTKQEVVKLSTAVVVFVVLFGVVTGAFDYLISTIIKLVQL